MLVHGKASPVEAARTQRGVGHRSGVAGIALGVVRAIKSSG